MRSCPGIVYLALGIAVFIIDRASKLYALFTCYDQPCLVNKFLSFDVTFNRGISWGILHSGTDTVFMIVLFVNSCITALLAWYAYHRFIHNNSILGESLIIIGSC